MSVAGACFYMCVRTVFAELGGKARSSGKPKVSGRRRRSRDGSSMAEVRGRLDVR